MDAGDRNTPVTIQNFSTSRDTATNEELQAWSEFRVVWVKFDPIRGKERFVKGSEEVEKIHQLRGDFLDWEDVDETMRVLLGARVLDIVSVLLDHNDRREVLVVCRETDQAA
jgi:head-tail adaptor